MAARWSVATGDLDGDGHPDIAVANYYGYYYGNVSVLMNLGNGTFGPTQKFG